jgi:hypothetical protein
MQHQTICLRALSLRSWVDYVDSTPLDLPRHPIDRRVVMAKTEAREYLRSRMSP